MTDEIQIRHISEETEFKTLKESWSSLLHQNHINDAFLTWEWLFSWWMVFKEGKQLWLITAWKKNKLVGIAPLMLEKRGKLGLNSKILCTLGTPMNDVGGLIIQDQDGKILDALIAYIMEQKKKWDILELTEFLVEGPEIKALKDAFNHPGFSIVEKNREHYYLPIETNWETYYESLSRKFRKNLRRAERNTEKLGTVKIKRYAGDQLAWEHFESIIDINQHAHYPRLYHSKREQDFLKELLKHASQWLNVYILTVDKDKIAYEYGFLYNDCFEDWRAGFDTRIDPSISVGKLLSLRVMENCFKRNCIAIDFMRGAHEYKTEWQPQSRYFMEVRIFKHQSVLAAAAYVWLRKIKPVLKRF
jgi:CelD/BcsL family acetyltransferase involved in cellulose biosynthesis